MNVKPLIALFFGVGSVPFWTNYSQAQVEVEQVSNKYAEDRIGFYCGTVVETDTGNKIPTTLAYVPQRKAHIPIVAWASDRIAAWSPERRCDAVSAKFETFHQDGRLNYLSNGQVAGEQVICALPEKKEQCSGENQLFQIREGTDPEEVIVGLQEILVGKRAETDVIYQSSGDRNYISISELLENAPGIDEESLDSN